MYKEIDADLDEVTVYSTTSNNTWSKNEGGESVSAADEKKESAPAAAPEGDSKPAAKSRAAPIVVDEQKPADGENAPLFCEGLCIIS